MATKYEDKMMKVIDSTSLTEREKRQLQIKLRQLIIEIIADVKIDQVINSGK